MIFEILDAIEEQYGKYSDVTAECYAFLGGLQTENDDLFNLTSKAQERLYEMDRCVQCGEKLRYKFIYENHGEGMIEPRKELFCPYHGEDWY